MYFITARGDSALDGLIDIVQSGANPETSSGRASSFVSKPFQIQN
jgi:hypothetical protein